MAASIARKVAAILFALAMVGSVAVGPALADDDGDVTVGGDGVDVGGDDGVTVGAGDDGSTNGSTTVSADADEDGVDADASVSGGDGSGTDGSVDCSLDTSTQEADCEPSGTDSGSDAPSLDDAPDAPDAPSVGGSGGGSDGGSAAPPTTMDEISTPDEPIEAPDLPVNYEEDVPFGAFPDFCTYPQYVLDQGKSANPVEPTDPLPGAVKEQLPKQAPKKPPQTPVGNPVSLVGVPVSQCTVFNPYNPAVNPTNPPDDPSATVTRRDSSVSQDSVFLNTVAQGTTGDGPSDRTMALVYVSRGRTVVMLDTYATNGRTPSEGTTTVRIPDNQPNRTKATAGVTLFGQGASASLTCDGSECKPKAGGVPSGNAIPAIPAGGGSGGESPEPDPSAGTGQPYTYVGPNGTVYILEDRSATLGEGLPGARHETTIIRDDGRTQAEEDAQASGNGRQGNLETTYHSGTHPGDDDVYVLAKGEGAGVIVGLNCNDYRCTPADNTGVYAGPGSMIFDMLPDAPGQGS